MSRKIPMKKIGRAYYAIYDGYLISVARYNGNEWMTRVSVGKDDSYHYIRTSTKAYAIESAMNYVESKRNSA